MNTQCQRVIEYIKINGSITQLEALNNIGVMRLASRISDLRRIGYEIRKEMIKDKNRFGEAVSFARYSLVEDKNVQ